MRKNKTMTVITYYQIEVQFISDTLSKTAPETAMYEKVQSRPLINYHTAWVTFHKFNNMGLILVTHLHRLTEERIR